MRRRHEPDLGYWSILEVVVGDGGAVHDLIVLLGGSKTEVAKLGA